MTINDHVSINPIIGFMLWAVCYIIDILIHLFGQYHNMEFPVWFMQAGQLVFWCIGGFVGLITIFEWLKKTFPWFKKRFKK